MKFYSRALNLFSATSALVGASVGVGLAAPQHYATGIQPIRAGVVVLDESTRTGGFIPNGSFSGAPYALFNLDQAINVKPIGWDLYNPHAPGIVTNDIEQRWQSVNVGTYPTLNAPISKQNAEYWSVHLNQISDTQLSDYDVLLLAPTEANLTSLERQRLTKFVDQGGILWIDTATITRYGQHSISPQNGFPINFDLLGGSGNASADPNSLLLQSPYQITSNDLDILFTPTGGVLGSYFGMKPSAPQSFDLTNANAFNRYLGITYFNGNPTMAVTHEGDGLVVVTTMGAAELLNNGLNNIGYTAGPSGLGVAGVSAAKLAVNIISQRQDYSQPGGGSRNTGSNPIDVTAPVLSRWSDESILTVAAAPVVFKGLAFVSANSMVYAYDAKPGSDVDGDGDPDDGIYSASGAIDNSLRDYSIGKPYDRIWKSPTIPGPISSPVCAELPDGYGSITNVVMVTDASGSLHVFNAFPRTANGQLIGGTNNEIYTLKCPATGFSLANGVPSYLVGPALGTAGPILPNPPTVSGDLAFLSDTAGAVGNGPSGAVWVVDLSSGSILTSGNLPWEIGNTAANPTNQGQLAAFTAQPTVGYVPIHDNSGGYDKVLYVPGTMGANSIPCFESLWFGVKGESPASYRVAGNTLTIDTRASTASAYIFPANGGTPQTRAQAALFPRLTFLSSNNQPIDLALITSGPTQDTPGELIYTINRSAAAFNALVSGIRVDYTLDWGKMADQPTLPMERGRCTFPVPTENGGAEQRVLGPIALTPGGTAVMTVGDPRMSDPGGSLWWINELQGRGAFSVTGKWSLYPSYTLPATPVAVKENAVLEDADPIQNLIPAPNVTLPMSNFFWTGAPTIAGDQVIATALARKGTGRLAVPVTVVMAFAAEPPTPRFPAANLPTSFNLVQPDFDRSSAGSLTSPTGPDVSSNLGSATNNGIGPVQYDVTSGVVSLSSLAPVQVGQITISDCLNMSAPFLIQSGEVSTLYQPEAHGGVWNPLHWYSVDDGTSGTGRPLVTGNTIFLGGTSIVPKLLNSGNFSSSGVINAIDASIAPNDPFVVHAADRPWENQVAVLTNSNGTVQPDPHIKMPSTLGISSFADYKTRLIQQTIGTSTTAFGVVGGGDTLLAYGDHGVYGLSRADFSICDNGRFLRTDSNGNAIFDSNVTLNTGAGAGSPVGNVKSVVRPTRAYPLADLQTLIVDPGSNRVMKIDSTGSELRAIDRFTIDPNFLPSGYTANESRTLSGPQDAITYSNYVYKTGSGQVTGQANEEFWVHYLIADTGNHRLVELIDRYTVNNGRIGPLVTLQEADPNATASVSGAAVPVTSVPQIGVLLWHSPAAVSGRNFAYNSVTRVFLAQANNSGRYVYVAGVGNTQPQLTAQGLDTAGNLSLGQSSTGSGGVVIFDPASTSGIQVYNSYQTPDLSGTPFWDPAANGGAGAWDVTTPVSTKSFLSPLGNLRSVAARSLINGQIALMITQSNGVYEFAVDPTSSASAGDLGSPTWFINAAAYSSLRGPGNGSNPMDFIPAYAKRLDSGDVLVVNSYLGATLGRTAFNGEVLMLDGSSPQYGTDNLGFASQSIKFNLPQGRTGVRPLLSPIFADRR